MTDLEKTTEILLRITKQFKELVEIVNDQEKRIKFLEQLNEVKDVNDN